MSAADSSQSLSTFRQRRRNGLRCFVAFATDANLSGRHELGSVPLAGGPMRTLAHAGLGDRDPRFSADGRTIVFTTAFPIDRTRWTLTAARSLPAPE